MSEYSYEWEQAESDYDSATFENDPDSLAGARLTDYLRAQFAAEILDRETLTALAFVVRAKAALNRDLWSLSPEQNAWFESSYILAGLYNSQIVSLTLFYRQFDYPMQTLKYLNTIAQTEITRSRDRA